MYYEDEQRRLLKLWEEVNDEESDIGSISDDEPPDHISENSYHSNSEEKLPEIRILVDSQNNERPEVSETEELNNEDPCTSSTPTGPSVSGSPLPKRNLKKFKEIRKNSKTSKKFEKIRRNSNKFEEIRRNSKKFEEIRRNSKKFEEIRRNSKKFEEILRNSKKF
ncbi:unnamed protein product [Psylliodes chrysocephalus]|uniref:Uncharacterized protein n=1 Tax=Psylliodes chrysocephalus TaxID=3402493 RepID=A0A9P0CT01_9CUCU|nr:unnamed protein product [Psylliodes chrysocephala]